MCLGRFYFEKNQKNATLAVAFRSKHTYSRSLETSCLWYSIECKIRGVPEVICAQRHETNYMSPHNSRWLLDLSPPNNPINARALSLGTR